MTAQPAANPRASLQFLGAAGTVTGSKYLLTIGDRRFLIDCGMFQGDKEWRVRNWDPFPVKPSTIEAVLLTHAHMDHSGMLPALVKQGFAGKIYATPDTAKLAEIVLLDSAHLQEKDAENANERGYSKHQPAEPLYTTADVERTVRLFSSVEFDTPLNLGHGLVVTFTRAGHILGSASVRVAVDGTSVLFSGDLGRHEHPVLQKRGTPEPADYVVIESTYGDREHPDPTDLPHEEMAAAIRTAIKRGGSVLIPAFAVDRTEIVLKVLTTLFRDHRIPEVPVYVNSPMALAALHLYEAASERGELRSDLKDSDWIDIPELHEAKTQEDSIALNNPARPCIIISSSGMATGGRVVHHLQYMLPDPKNAVILTGYQAVGTRGRDLIEGARELKMFGRYIPVRAAIVQDEEFSVHADASDLIDWLKDLGREPETIFVVHGEEGSSEAFVQRIHDDLGWTAVVPHYEEVVRLAPVKKLDAPAVEAPAAPAAEATASPATPGDDYVV